MNSINQQNKILISSFVVFLLLYYFINKKSQNQSIEKNETPKEAIVADTFIPRGYVLVPISLDPASQISGLVDQFAVVDLYAPNKELHSNILIAQSVKLIRAPLNPQQFAVLVTEDLSREIMKINTPFWVTLQNRQSLQANLEKNKLLGSAITNESAKISPLNVKKNLIFRAPVKIEYYKGI